MANTRRSKKTSAKRAKPARRGARAAAKPGAPKVKQIELRPIRTKLKAHVYALGAAIGASPSANPQIEEAARPSVATAGGSILPAAPRAMMTSRSSGLSRCIAASYRSTASLPIASSSVSIMGLADPLIERDLGIDGIGEAVLYAIGVGHRPAR